MATPRPWLPSCGLTTTGTPISQAACPGVFGIAHRPAARHRHAHGAEQTAGQFLVLSNRLGDGAGAVGLGGLDAPLFPAVAEDAPGSRCSTGGRECPRPERPATMARVLGPRQTSLGDIAQPGEMLGRM